MNTLDIIIIILLAITISIIIGLSIVNLIDKKINNVSVNIPPIVVPEQNVKLNVNGTVDGCLKICPKGRKNGTQKEQGKELGKELGIEHFIVSDAQDIHNYTSLIDEGMKESDEFEDKDNNGSADKEEKPKSPKVSPKHKIMTSCKKFNPDLIPLFLEDPLMRGYNYGNYSNYANPYQYNRLLSQATRGLNPKDNKQKNIPMSYNYGFKETPAMRMK